MYGKVLGCSTVTCAGAVVLPNTGGNPILTAASIACIAVGGTALLSIAVRLVMKKAYKA